MHATHPRHRARFAARTWILCAGSTALFSATTPPPPPGGGPPKADQLCHLVANCVSPTTVTPYTVLPGTIPTSEYGGGLLEIDDPNGTTVKTPCPWLHGTNTVTKKVALQTSCNPKGALPSATQAESTTDPDGRRQDKACGTETVTPLTIYVVTTGPAPAGGGGGGGKGGGGAPPPPPAGPFETQPLAGNPLATVVGCGPFLLGETKCGKPSL